VDTAHSRGIVEEPEIQAIKNIAAQLKPFPGEHPTISRDYEYKRLGAVSLLGGIDLHTGQVHSLVRDRHRSRELIKFLNILDEKYPDIALSPNNGTIFGIYP